MTPAPYAGRMPERAYNPPVGGVGVYVGGSFGYDAAMNRDRHLQQLRTRHKALRWWLVIAREHPEGVVPRAVAARLMGWSQTRIGSLIKSGRLRTVGPPPGGSRVDIFIPVLDLIDAPFAADQGRPGSFGANRVPNSKKSPEI
jgi:hypothetical protein